MALQCSARSGTSMKKISTILVTLIVIVAAVFLWQQNKKQRDEKTEVLDCVDIVQSCGNSKFTVRFKESPQVMKPLHLALASIGAEHIQNAHANFAMKGMEMGLNRYQLVKTGPDEWQAEVTLPVCVQGRSNWEMLIEMQTEGGTQRFLMPFSAANK